MANQFFLESLEIHNFRAFDQLTIKHVGRVNLITGKNNVGKSSLLEALWLYGHQGHPSVIWRILESRDEGEEPRYTNGIASDRNVDGNELEIVEVIKQLFHLNTYEKKEVRVGPVGNTDKTLTVDFEELIDGQSGLLRPILRSSFNNQKASYAMKFGPHQLPEGISDSCVMVSANGLDAESVQQFWDNIALTNLEDEVLMALQIIAKEIERVNLLAGRKHRKDRVPIVKIRDLNTPVPLRRLGDGVNRLFGIALALANAQDGMLLIDEVESGLHYSVQPDIWRLIFEVAHRLNVQVFATTHSWDCLTAFQEAAKADEQDEGVLIRLAEKNGRIVSSLFDEEDLEVVAREGIEVR